MKRAPRILLILLTLLITLPALAAPKHVTILHFNDFHGHLEPDVEDGVARGGAARIATIVSDIEKENRARGWETFVLFGGDAFTGTLISSEFRGAAEFDFLNMLGLDAFVVGNHEFDNGLPRFQELIAEVKYPIVSANISWRANDERMMPATALLTKDDVTLALLGLTTEETAVSTHPSNVRDLRFSDAIKEAKREMRRLKKLSPFRIALTHLGVEGDIRLAKKVRGFIAVIGGHDHVSPDEYCRLVRRVPVCQTPPNGCFIGRLDFSIDEKKIDYLGSQLIPVTADVTEDRAVKRMIAHYTRKLSKSFDRVIARSAETLTPSREQRTRLGTLVAEAMRSKTGAEVAFVNSGGIRAPLKSGPVRVRDVLTILPFRNRLITFDVTGAQLETILAHGIEHGGGAFPQVAGIDYEIVDDRPTGITIEGRPMERKRTYRAVTVDFLVDGGDGYGMLKGLSNAYDTSILVSHAFADYLREQRVLRP